MSEEFDPFSEENEYDTSNVSKENINDDDGGAVSEDGKYHAVIFDVVYNAPVKAEGDTKAKLPFAKLKLRILAGTVESQIDKIIYHNLYLAGWEDKKTGVMKLLDERQLNGLLAFCYAFGTLSEDKLGQEAVTLELGMIERLENTTAIVQVQLEPKNDKVLNPKTGNPYDPKHKIRFNSWAWPLGSDKVEGVPFDPDYARYQAGDDGEDDADMGGV